MRDLTFDEACALTAGASMWTTVAAPEPGVESFSMADGPMGIASGNVDERDVSLLTPCPTALGASWDVNLVYAVGELVGGDAIRRGVDAVLAPTLNLARSPLAGRAFEYFSEDPILTGVLGSAWTKGLQATGTGAIAKHLVCNDSETERDSVDVRVDEKVLRELYLLPFEMVADAGCAGILAAYNRLNGSWCTEQKHVLREIIKDEWRYPRVIMSDWFATQSTDGAINAGLDLEMPGPGRRLGPHLAKAVADGGVEQARVEEAAHCVAATARQVRVAKAEPLAIDAAGRVLEDAAAAGFVLLRNEGGLLPVRPEQVKRVAVIGPNAASPCYQGGTFAKIAVDPSTPKPIDAIRARFGDACEIVYEPGVDPQPRLPNMPLRPARDIGDGCALGMTLDYFDTPDASGAPVFSETRNTNSLVWFVGVHTQGRFDRPGAVRASGLFTPQTSGPHRFYLGATGESRLCVDGREVMRAGGELKSADVMGVLKTGDADSVDVELEAGREVAVTITFRYAGARVHGLWYGLRAPDDPEAMLNRAVEAARNADVVFLVVGETSDSSVESKDRPDTKLAPEQLKLIEAVCQANPRTAAIVNVGHAFDAEFAQQAAALMVVWYPGQGFAGALASVLAGDREPGGRMPVSIARREEDYTGYDLKPGPDGRLVYAEGVRIGYRGLIANATPARHTLGSGFGYARFDWSDATVEGRRITLTVRNTSDRRGSDVVQAYCEAPEARLIGFTKVELEAGETRRVDIDLQAKALRVWNSGWESLRGELNVRLARSAEDGGLAVSVQL